jgi:hypothetical protein
MCIQVKNVTAKGDYNTLKPFPDPPFYAFINNLCTTCEENQLDFFRQPQVENNWYLGMTFFFCNLPQKRTIRVQFFPLSITEPHTQTKHFLMTNRP